MKAIKFTYISLFPELIQHYLSDALIEKARAKGLLKFNFIRLRDYAVGKYKSVDDAPFGGGDGMVLQVGSLQKCLSDVLATILDSEKVRVIYLSPQGRKLDQALVRELSGYDHLVLLSGRYGGVDERALKNQIDEEISIGDFVLSGGELPSLVLTEAISRMVPGVLGDSTSAEVDSFSDGLLEAPQFTRPQDFEGHVVPEVLTSGNHIKIQDWKKNVAALVTLKKRPDLIELKKDLDWKKIAKFYQEMSSSDRKTLQLENLETQIQAVQFEKGSLKR